MHAGDNRLAIIATLFLPVVGWVRMLSYMHCLLLSYFYHVAATWLAGPPTSPPDNDAVFSKSLYMEGDISNLVIMSSCKAF